MVSPQRCWCGCETILYLEPYVTYLNEHTYLDLVVVALTVSATVFFIDILPVESRLFP